MYSEKEKQSSYLENISIKNKNKGVYLYGKTKSKFKKGICGSI